MSSRDEREGRRAARRGELVATLMPVIERHLRAGVAYPDVSVHTLVTEGHLSRSTFYSYFTDKTDLLRACAEAVSDQTVRMAQEWFGLRAEIDYDRMRTALRSAVREYLAHAPLMAAVYDAATHDPSIHDVVTQIMDRLVDRFADHIAEGQSAGWVDDRLLPRETAAWIVWMFERTQHQGTHDDDPESLDRLIDEGTAVVWRALYAPAVGASVPSA
ncbi:MAG: TetR/AcrR family transcriptional regulator [Solirubrobacteraceae bacterium]